MPLDLSHDQVRLLATLFPQLTALSVERMEEQGERVQIVARTHVEGAKCRGCGWVSSRVHDRYRRRLHDLSCGGRPVLIKLEVRRFICGNIDCPVATFAEQVNGLTERHQQRTVGLRALLERVALALAGSAGSRLARVLGVIVSRCTLLRLVRALPDPEIGHVTVLGVDDWAKRKGHSYASVLVDLADEHGGHRIIDVLPDREASTLSNWLLAHPGVRVICRDRAGAFAAGAREGAPEAQQVADRFHLWQDLGKAVEKTVIANRAHLPEPKSEPAPREGPRERPTPHTQPAESILPEDGAHDVLGRERPVVARHRERYAAIHALLEEGHSKTGIARRLGIGRATVGRFTRAENLEEVLFKSTHRTGILDGFKPYLNQRWNEGCVNASVLHTELQTLGWVGGVGSVRRYLHQFRGAPPSPTRPDPRCAQSAPAAPAPPKPRRVVRWIMTRPDHLAEHETQRLARILERSPELAATARHVRDFATMMTERQGHRLDDWITAVRADSLPALHSLARGLELDCDAVRAGLTLPYSSGAVEGTICKIKFWKRLMFGRANLDLIRKIALLN